MVTGHSLDPPILHDDLEVLGGVGDQVDILQWIAVDQQQIGERSLFHDAELARLNDEETPPPAVSLIWEAPCMSCSRTRRRTSSGLSATILPPICSMRLSVPIVRGSSDNWRKSPCPLVTVIRAPDGKIRGPAMIPESMALFSPNTGPPTSRTVMKPHIRVSVASTAAAILLYPTSPAIT